MRDGSQQVTTIHGLPKKQNISILTQDSLVRSEPQILAFANPAVRTVVPKLHALDR